MKHLLTTLLLSLFIAVPSQALTINGVDVKETMSLDNQELVLNGAGVRTKWFVDGYIAALYLAEKTTDAEAVIEADEPMAVSLIITSNMITPKRMSDSTRDGFVSSTGGNIEPIADEIEMLISAFKDSVEEGDVFNLVYKPETGVTVYRNGEEKTRVEGLEFKKALFGIWISERGIQKKLRQQMMGS